MAVIVDCTPTTFCDSVGFNTLLLANQKAREAKAKLLFVIAPNSQLRRVLELLKMQDALEMYPSIDAAVAAATASRQLSSRRRCYADLARITLAIAVGAAVTACSGPGTGRPATAARASYYLTLGDSLSQGVQPDAAGESVQTRQGVCRSGVRGAAPRSSGARQGSPGRPGCEMSRYRAPAGQG
jgi:hypothetical protein